MGVPVVLEDQSVTVGSVFKCQYVLNYDRSTPVGNLSYVELFEEDESRSENDVSKRDIHDNNSGMTRWYVYKGIEALINRYFLNIYKNTYNFN